MNWARAEQKVDMDPHLMGVEKPIMEPMWMLLYPQNLHLMAHNVGKCQMRVIIRKFISYQFIRKFLFKTTYFFSVLS